MIFSIRRIIREFAAPDHRISCPRRLWQHVLTELNRRGEGCHEAGAFLLGVERTGRSEVKTAVFYDELDRDAYSTGVCVLRGDAFAKLWAFCREQDLTVVADAHTHIGAAFQSRTDRNNPMVARAGHVAIIVPHMARHPVTHSSLGVYEYRGQHRWVNRSGKKAEGFFYVGWWS